jgi:starvation-inducible DNA-binding protein
MNEQDFRHYHVLLDDEAEQLLVRMDNIADGPRKIGGTTIRFLSHLSEHQHLKNSNEGMRRAE